MFLASPRVANRPHDTVSVFSLMPRDASVRVPYIAVRRVVVDLASIPDSTYAVSQIGHAHQRSCIDIAGPKHRD